MTLRYILLAVLFVLLAAFALFKAVIDLLLALWRLA
jgi:hypothetical protein